MTKKNRMMLVHMPALPFSVEALTPQRDLASLGTLLQEEGTRVCIYDDACLSTLQALADTPDPAVPPPYAPFSKTRQSKGTSDRIGRFINHLRQSELPDAIVVQCHRRCDFVVAKALCTQLKHTFPCITRVVFGRYIDETGCSVMSGPTSFHAACTGDRELGLTALNAHLAEPEKWPLLPNLILSGPQTVQKTPASICLRTETLPEPAYNALEYTFPYQDGKFHIYSIEQSRCNHHRPWGRFQAPGMLEHVRSKPAAHVAREIEETFLSTRSRALYLSGPFTPAEQQDALAQALIALQLPLAYARTSHIPLQSKRLSLQAQSGCLALDFHIETGSFRLLHDFYGHEFGISDAIHLLRTIQNKDIDVTTHFTYPCPHDDHHTIAETLRLLKHSRAGHYTCQLPQLMPGSAWYQTPDAFGFKIAYKRLSNWITGDSRKNAFVKGFHKKRNIMARAFAEEVTRLQETAGKTRLKRTTSNLTGLIQRITRNPETSSIIDKGLDLNASSSQLTAIECLMRTFNMASSIGSVQKTYQECLLQKEAVGN